MAKTTTRRRTASDDGARPVARKTRKPATSHSRLSRTLVDHDEIRRWAEAREGTPSAVKGTSHGKHDIGMIRIDFPGYSGEGKLEPVEWDKWFQKFDDSNLALIVQEKTAGGEISHFNKLVAREGAGSRRARQGSSKAGHARSRRHR